MLTGKLDRNDNLYRLSVFKIAPHVIAHGRSLFETFQIVAVKREASSLRSMNIPKYVEAEAVFGFRRLADMANVVGAAQRKAPSAKRREPWASHATPAPWPVSA